MWIKKVFEGRLKRKGYFAIFGLYLVALVFWSDFVVYAHLEKNVFAYYVSVLIFFLFLPFAVKRIRDIGLPGWVAVFLLVPYVGTLGAFVMLVWPSKK